MSMASLRLLLGFWSILSISNGNEVYQDGLGSYGVPTDKGSGEEDPHCLSHIHRFYRQMKCQPEMSADSKCPTSYKCATLLGRSHEKCYYDGKEYPVGHNLTRDTVTFHTPCIQSCQCVRNYKWARWSCVQKPPEDCQVGAGCKHLHFLEDFKCCERGITSCNQGKPGSVKCVYQGRSYNEGERFFPSDDITCSHCVCASGFNGTIAPPYCAPLLCSLEMWEDTPNKLTDGCAPVYISQTGCCPINFRCPEPSDRVIKQDKLSKPSKTEKKCVFGNLTLEVGDSLPLEIQKNGRKVECACRVPPMVSCVFKDFVVTEEMWQSLANMDPNY